MAGKILAIIFLIVLAIFYIGGFVGSINLIYIFVAANNNMKNPIAEGQVIEQIAPTSILFWEFKTFKVKTDDNVIKKVAFLTEYNAKKDKKIAFHLSDKPNGICFYSTINHYLILVFGIFGIICCIFLVLIFVFKFRR
jgi:hypothetical protein